MFKIIKKADIILFVLLLLLGVGLSVPGFVRGSSNTSMEGAQLIVEIRAGGELIDSFNLEDNMEIYILQKDGEVSVIDSHSTSIAGSATPSQEINEEISAADHVNKVIIKDKQVQMEEASCHNQVCIKQGIISRPNQQIICLPNRIVVAITSNSETVSEEEGGDADVISG